MITLNIRPGSSKVSALRRCSFYPPNRLRGFVAKCRAKAYEGLSAPTLRSQGRRGVVQEIDACHGKLVAAVIVLAVDDSRLEQVRLQSALGKSALLQGFQNLVLLAASAVDHATGGVPLKGYARGSACSSTCQRCNAADNRVTTPPCGAARYWCLLMHPHQRPEPAQNIRKHPSLPGMAAHRAHQEVMIDVIK